MSSVPTRLRLVLGNEDPPRYHRMRLHSRRLVHVIDLLQAVRARYRDRSLLSWQHPRIGHLWTVGVWNIAARHQVSSVSRLAMVDARRGVYGALRFMLAHCIPTWLPT